MKNYDTCPVCGKRKIRVNNSYYEPFIRCSYCKIGAFEKDFEERYLQKEPDKKSGD